MSDPEDWFGLPECFVIQPFDGGQFDKRYEDIYAPAIRDAGLEPYRVDRDPAASIPIEQIAKRVVDSAVCFADITQDNPNVWLELGLAIAANREVTLVCAESRQQFPFDVQHRNIIRYKTESASDFTNLRKNITARLKASRDLQRNKENLGDISPVKETAGLSPHEQVLLVLTAQRMDGPTDTVSAYILRRDMAETGFNDLAFALSTRSLGRRGFMEVGREEDGNGESFVVYAVTESGFDWLEKNQKRLELRVRPSGPPAPPASPELNGLDELPF